LNYSGTKELVTVFLYIFAIILTNKKTDKLLTLPHTCFHFCC